MGSVRTLLAISVVFSHSYGFLFVGGRLAVELFYIISGFLISYILVEAKSYQTVSAFYANRFLRLFPIYWFIAVATLCAILFASVAFNQTHSVFNTFKSVDFLGKISLTFANFFVLGQDLIMFTGVRDGEFQFVSDFQDSEVQVWQGLLVPQAWTLGVELSFYLIAPFILIRRKLMFFLLLCSILLRIYLIYLGVGTEDPWTYRFFPTELALFLVGACSHQFLKPYYDKNSLISERATYIITISVFIYCCAYFILPFRAINTFILMGYFTLSLPFLFSFQKDRVWDRKIGDLSYPIYISHMLVIWTVGYAMSEFGFNYESISGSVTIVIATVIFSYLIKYSIGSVVENYRSKVKSRQIILE